MRRFTLALATFCGLGVTSQVLAQATAPTPVQAPFNQSIVAYPSGGGGMGMGMGGFGFGYPFWPGGESYGDQVSRVVRAYGENALLNSQAAVNLQAARSQDITNDLNSANTFYEMRRIHNQYKDEERQRQFVGPQKVAEFNQRMLPRRLTPSQLDHITGEINWPEVLKRPPYNEPRVKLDDLFRSRASHAGGIGSERYSQIRDFTNQMLETLRQSIREVPTSEYVYCRNFLTSLAYEASFASQ